MSAAPALSVLFAVRETWPTFRQDVVALFGKYLPREGIRADLLTVAGATEFVPWPGGVSLLRRGAARGPRKWVAALIQDLRLLWLAFGSHDLIQIRDKSFGALVGLVAARLARKPFCYWMSFPFGEAWMALAGDRREQLGAFWRTTRRVQGWLTQILLYRLVLKYANHVFVQSDRMLEDLAARGMSGDRLTAIPMGVDLEAVAEQPLVGERAGSGSERVIVYLGALERARRPDMMLDALAMIGDVVPAAILVLVGDSHNPRDRAWLSNEIRARGLEQKVRVTGWLPTRQAWAWVKAAEVGLSPFPRGAIYDSASPTKAVEYLAHGVPVVANDQPDQAYVLTQSGGGLVVEPSAAAFAAAVVRLLTDRELATAMGERGREWVRRERSYELLAAKVAGVYRGLVNARSSTGR